MCLSPSSFKATERQNDDSQDRAAHSVQVRTLLAPQVAGCNVSHDDTFYTPALELAAPHV
jgi:hypothetical protein